MARKVFEIYTRSEDPRSTSWNFDSSDISSRICKIEKRKNPTPSRGQDVIMPMKRQFARSASCARRRQIRAKRPSRDGQGHGVLAPRALISRTRYVIAQTAHAYMPMYARICIQPGFPPPPALAQLSQSLYNRYLIGDMLDLKKKL